MSGYLLLLTTYVAILYLSIIDIIHQYDNKIKKNTVIRGRRRVDMIVIFGSLNTRAQQYYIDGTKI